MNDVERFLNGRVTLHAGDCTEAIKPMADCSMDSVVTDPPYALMFMGKKWDSGDTAHAIAFWSECLRVLKPGGYILAFGGTRTYHRLACAIEDAGFEIRDMVQWLYGSGFPKNHNVSTSFDKSLGWFDDDELDAGMCSHFAAYHEGHGTALKPACEPICLARKPLQGTVAANVLRWGTGAINIDGCRVEGEKRHPGNYVDKRSEAEVYGTFKDSDRSEFDATKGRFPANVITDGSDEVVAMFPQRDSPRANGNPNNPKRGSNHVATSFGQGDDTETHDYRDTGSAARFFYQSKATKKDRAGSKHPTVKPVDLIQYLVRMVTPRGGTVLDPFAGTGTTAEAAFREGCNAVLIERNPEYLTDIRRRMALVMAGPDERRFESAKAKGEPRFARGTLFYEVPS